MNTKIFFNVYARNSSTLILYFEAITYFDVDNHL